MLLMPTNPKTVLALSIAEQIGIIIALSIMGIIAIMSMKLVYIIICMALLIIKVHVMFI